MHRRVALRSSSWTTLSASAMRPLEASQRGDSGISQRSGMVSTEGIRPTMNIASAAISTGAHELGRPTRSGRVNSVTAPASVRAPWLGTNDSVTIDMIIGYPPGGSNDIIARQLAQKLSDVRIDKAATYAERWSDHAPVVVTYRV